MKHTSSRHAPASSYEDATTLFPSCQGHVPQQQHLPLSQATAIAIHRLQRLMRVTVERSVMRDGHRDYVLQLTRQALQPVPPMLPSTTTYQVRHRYAVLRELRAQLHERTYEARHASDDACVSCTRLADSIALDHSERGRVRQLAGSTSHECARLEQFLSAVLDHVVLHAATNAMRCVGCEWTLTLVAEIFKEPYHASTGLI